MPARKKAQEAAPKPSKAEPVSGITDPIAMDTQASPAPIVDAWVPPHNEVKRLAITMCLANRETKPEIFVGGRPLWRNWEVQAVNALAAHHYFTEGRNAE